jgi:hypothetical protein
MVLSRWEWNEATRCWECVTSKRGWEGPAAESGAPDGGPERLSWAVVAEAAARRPAVNSLWEAPEPDADGEAGVAAEAEAEAEAEARRPVRYWRGAAVAAGTRVRAAAAEAAARPCELCAVFGHRAEDCAARRCDKCGRRGHAMAACTFWPCDRCERVDGPCSCSVRR